MESVIKLKLNLDEESRQVIEGQSRICNWLYNNLLQQANQLREQYRETQSQDIAKTLYTKRGLRNLIPEMKKEHPFLRTVHSSPMKNVGLRLSESIQAYQQTRKGKRKGNQTGWPRFRSNKVKPFSLLYDEPNKGFKLDGKKLRLSLGSSEKGKRLYVEGSVEKSLQEFSDVEIRQLRIKEELGQFFAIFTVKRPDPSPKTTQPRKIIALDPNHKNLSWGVDLEGVSTEIPNPWFMKQLQKRINQVKSKRDKCEKKSTLCTTEQGKEYWKPSRRWVYLDRILNRLHWQRREQTKAFIYGVAHFLYRRYDLVSIGNYTPLFLRAGTGLTRNMKREMFNQSLIGRLKKTLEWVAKKSGKQFMEWDEYCSTKTCSYCQHQLVVSLQPSVRKWECPSCSRNLIRDENAARNGLMRTLESIKESSPGSGHLGEISSRCTVRFDGLGFHTVLSGVC